MFANNYLYLTNYYGRRIINTIKFIEEILQLELLEAQKTNVKRIRKNNSLLSNQIYKEDLYCEPCKNIKSNVIKRPRGEEKH